MEDSLAGSDKELGQEGGAPVTCRRERLTLDGAWAWEGGAAGTVI